MMASTDTRATRSEDAAARFEDYIRERSHEIEAERLALVRWRSDMEAAHARREQELSCQAELLDRKARYLADQETALAAMRSAFGEMGQRLEAAHREASGLEQRNAERLRAAEHLQMRLRDLKQALRHFDCRKVATRQESGVRLERLATAESDFAVQRAQLASRCAALDRAEQALQGRIQEFEEYEARIRKMLDRRYRELSRMAGAPAGQASCPSEAAASDGERRQAEAFPTARPVALAERQESLASRERDCLERGRELERLKKELEERAFFLQQSEVAINRRIRTAEEFEARATQDLRHREAMLRQLSQELLPVLRLDNKEEQTRRLARKLIELTKKLAELSRQRAPEEESGIFPMPTASRNRTPTAFKRLFLPPMAGAAAQPSPDATISRTVRDTD